MKNFTHAGLAALLRRVVGEHDPSFLKVGKVVDPMKEAVADAAEKTSLVEQVMARHGPGLLFAVGQSLHLADATPAFTVLKRSGTSRVLAEKFMRLEGYHHSSHRTSIVSGNGQWDCSRTSKDRPATTGENYLIAGLLLGLLMTIGRDGCRLKIGRQTYSPEDLMSATLEPGTDASRFQISWTPVARDRDQEVQFNRETEHSMMSDRLANLFGTDLGRSWKISDAAKILAVSERSLQRRLNDESRSYSSILRRARMQRATLCLTETSMSLAEIGYCCGYADQAHFQRDFLRTANVTPGAFRRINHASDSVGKGPKSDV